MKKLLIVAAVSAMFASSAFAQPTIATAGTFGNINVNNSIAGAVTANGGFSESQATNTQTVSMTIGAASSFGTASVAGVNVPTATAGTSGSVALTENSTAWNVSTGGAQGNAQSSGGSGAMVAGAQSIIGSLASGDGSARLGTTDVISANSNQGGFTGSIDSANFGSSQTVTGNVTPGSASASIASTLTGDATLNDGSGAITLNSGTSNAVTLAAPTTISVGDSGSFSATGTGQVGYLGVNSNANFGD